MPSRYSFENGYVLSAAGEADRNDGPQKTPVNESLTSQETKVVVGREIEVPANLDSFGVMPFVTSAGGSEPGVVVEFHFQSQMISDSGTYTTNAMIVRVPVDKIGVNKGPADQLPALNLRRIQLQKIVNNTTLALTVVNCEYRVMQSRS